MQFNAVYMIYYNSKSSTINLLQMYNLQYFTARARRPASRVLYIHVVLYIGLCI